MKKTPSPKEAFSLEAWAFSFEHHEGMFTQRDCAASASAIVQQSPFSKFI